ncbi:MAG: outer membrane beta-barrel protein [Bacteroidota bacterium]
MNKTYVLFFFLLFSFISFAQNGITLSGKIIKEKTQLPIESATIYIIHPKDSSVVEYTISDKNGFFKLQIKATTEKLILKIAAEGYQDFSKNIEKLTENKDLGITQLIEFNSLNEVVVKSSTPPVRVKKDTLEFNASSFKMRPDANVETLLKQLPGVEIDADKNITVNGKAVTQILVNGKSFFGEDGKIAIQNLPAEIIKKVQVSDKKTKEEEFTKQAARSNESSINLTIEKDKNKGFFGKFMGGSGTADRYESSALMSYFKDKRRISFLASSNNINSTGFSMDEVFDNMGSGRNYGSRAPTIGRGNGIIKSNLVGLNYADEWFKGSKTTGNYYFTNSDSENNNKTTEFLVLSEGSQLTESNSTTKKKFNGHDADLNFEYQIDSTARIIIVPKLKKGITTSNTHYYSTTTDDAKQIKNTQDSHNDNETDNNSFENSISFFKKMKKKGRYFTTEFRNENSKNESNSVINSSTLYEQGDDEDDIRDQISKTINQRDKYTLSFWYAEPITDSLSITFNVSSYLEKVIDDKKTFDGNLKTGIYINQNDLLTNFISSSKFQIRPSLGIQIRKKKYDFIADINAFIIKADFHSLYLDSKTNWNKNYIVPDGNLYYAYKFSNAKRMQVIYESGYGFPRADNFLAVANLENALNTIVGNPDLRLKKYHNLNLSFQNYDYQTRSGFYVYSRFHYDDINIVSSTDYDDSGKRFTTYENVFGSYEASLGVNWNKTIKKGTNKFSFDLGINNQFNLDKGFINSKLYEAETVRFSPNVRLGFDYGELLSIKPSYNFAYNITKYDNASIGSRSNKTHAFNIETTNYWPKHFVFGNDFGYTYNSNLSGDFKKAFYLWNTSLSYKFNEDKMTFKVKVYDILNQNQSTSRTITSTSIVDTENTVLKRYLMFSLLYKFQDFAVKKKN